MCHSMPPHARPYLTPASLSKPCLAPAALSKFFHHQSFFLAEPEKKIDDEKILRAPQALPCSHMGEASRSSGVFCGCIERYEIHHAVSTPYSPRSCFIFCKPSRMRPFTVPRGICQCSAISVCVYPAK